MSSQERTLSIGSVGLTVLAVGLGVVLIVLDLIPGLPGALHTVISGLPLLLIALAYLWHQLVIRSRLRGVDLVQGALLVVAFLLWSSYQFFPNVAHAVILNDGAILLFTTDVAFVVLAHPRRDAAGGARAATMETLGPRDPGAAGAPRVDEVSQHS